MNLTTANLKAIAWRVLSAFALAFLTGLPTTAAGWNVAVVEKAAVAGIFAAVALVQGLLWTIFSGQPQITKSGRVGAKAT